MNSISEKQKDTVGTLRIEVDGQEPETCEIHSPARNLIGPAQNGAHILGALVNNDVCSLSYPLTVNGSVTFLTPHCREGYRIYKRSLTFLLAKAVHETLPDAEFCVENVIGQGIFCTIRIDGVDGIDGINEQQRSVLEQAMQGYIEADLPIERARLSFAEATELLMCDRCDDKLNLLRYRNPPAITLFRCGGYWDLYNGVLADRTSRLDVWALHAYRNGLVLQFPKRRDGELVLGSFAPQPHLHDIFETHRVWGRTVGVSFLGDLNQIVAERKLDDLILTNEAMQDRRLVELANTIAAECDRIKWILIAGPSSSGKTTTSRRLAVHLKVHGLRPVTLEMDNYFVNREDNPVDENGDPDFEHIEAINLPLLHEHLGKLAAGEAIDLPRFNFREGRSEMSGKTLQLEDDQIVIMEGIHGLNPRLTEVIPDEQKFRLYIGCLTQLSVDRTNRMSTTDMRLIRRLIRDNRDRGHSARRTLQLWPAVRRGEKRWIFPYQGEADATFNSSLDYELAVFKSEVRPLLAEIKAFHAEYAEARRLLDLLEMIVSGPSSAVPSTSVLREFLGGSIFAKAH